MTRYYFKLREPAPGCQPKEGLLSVNCQPCEIQGMKFHGFADYNRVLSDEESKQYDIYDEMDICCMMYDAKEKELNKVIGRLGRKHSAVQINKDSQFAIVHRSTKKENTWQVSFFDEKGPWGDVEAKDLPEVVKELLDHGYNANEYEYAS